MIFAVADDSAGDWLTVFRGDGLHTEGLMVLLQVFFLRGFVELAFLVESDVG